MQPTVVDATKKLIGRRAPDLHSLQISWFGGEPLVAKRIVYDISRHATSLGEKLDSFSYQGDMTTNGYLLDLETAEKLVQLGVNSYQVSLDGPQATHDLSRIRADGRGTFSRIWSNLLAIRDSDLPLSIMLRVHFSPDTHLKLGPLIESINEEFGEDQRFTVFFRDISRLGGPNDDSILVFTEALKEQVQSDLQRKLRHKEQVAVASEDYVCYASRPNSLAIRSNGDLAKCTVALYDSRNKIGTLNPDGTITVEQDKMRKWIRGFSTLDEEDLACPYKGMKQGTRTKIVPLHRGGQ